MIRALAVVFALCATSAAADVPRMVQSQCDGAWARLVDISYGAVPGFLQTETSRAEKEQMYDVISTVTGDGWCAISGAQAAFADETSGFKTFQWRATEIDSFVTSDLLPTRFDGRFIGLVDPQLQDHDLDFIALRAPEDGLLILRDATLTAPDGGIVRLNAVLGGAYIRNVANLQTSLGGLHLRELALTADLTSGTIQTLAPELIDLDMADHISALSFAQLDQKSRRHLLDFERALPDAQGRLLIRLQSERGLGVMQFGMATTQEDGPKALSFALSGVTTTVDWQPE